MAKQKGGPSIGRAKSPQLPQAPGSAPEPGGIYVSGKLVILTIAAVALGAAAFSWWYRYTSTRRAAAFWGPAAVALIRDAPSVHWIKVEPLRDMSQHVHHPGGVFPEDYHLLSGIWHVTERRDVSKAPGLTHLRNALLMDRSFRVDERAAPEEWHNGLEFRQSPEGQTLVIFFSADGGRMLRQPPAAGADLAAPSARFAEGLTEILADWQQLPAR
jgi:hypothetical protein